MSFGHPNRRALLAVLLLSVVLPGSPRPLLAEPDVLWSIVTECLDPAVADYCSTCKLPRTEAPCATHRDCRETTEVWAETPDYVAIRDRKMCGCLKEFVHGLAIPRTRVTGVEDPRRPEGIWEFAWHEACRRIPDETAIALAVNPISWRSQNQLHVHIVRLRSDARKDFEHASVTRVERLDRVWAVAATTAKVAGWRDYGVLVAKDPSGGFLVVVEKGSPEGDFTENHCVRAGKY